MRTISSATRERLNSPASDYAALFFVTLEHDDLADPIRVVSDFQAMNYERVIDGSTETWIGFPFQISIMTDEDDPPTSKVTFQNVDRAIGQAIQSLATPPTVKIEVITTDQFDLTVNPRTELGTTEVLVSASGLLLRNVKVDAITIEADLGSWDFRQEPYPWQTATQDAFPGLFVL